MTIPDSQLTRCRSYFFIALALSLGGCGAEGLDSSTIPDIGATQAALEGEEASSPFGPSDTGDVGSPATGQTNGTDTPVSGTLFDYAGQTAPPYIEKDNGEINAITNAGATLGRVLFYDMQLSSDRTVSCATCHQQSVGFSDGDVVSTGVNGVTGRHSMRLVNARFADEARFFWDERAGSLEEQSTQPIRDHNEMGFSGVDGAPSIDDLLQRLASIDYYDELFSQAFASSVVTETAIQQALAQFVRSIQSFDSRYDTGLSSAGDPALNFPNFTADENAGKRLFMRAPVVENGARVEGSGLGCQGCHRAPEFDIDPNSGNNGVIGVAGVPGGIDTTITRSPTLRDVVSASGTENGPFMHDGSLETLDAVLDHYNSIDNNRLVNRGLDRRLTGGAPTPAGAIPGGQNLNLTATEKANVIAFLQTLGGSAVYTDSKWSDPFDAGGSLVKERLFVSE